MNTSLLTKNSDIENYLLTFFDFKSMWNYAQLSRLHNHFIQKNTIYKKLIEFRRETKFGRNRNYPQLIIWASKTGNSDILDMIKNIRYSFEINKDDLQNVMNFGSTHGHVVVLDWLKKSFKELLEKEISTENAIIYASANGHVNVLNWLQTNNLEFKNTRYAIHVAAKNEHISVLEWFKNNGFLVSHDMSYFLLLWSMQYKYHIVQWLGGGGSM